MSRTANSWRYWLLTSLSVFSMLVLVWLSLNYFSHVQAQAVPDALVELRGSLLADPTSQRGSWLRTLNPGMQDVQGDLVWNSEKQQGVMRFVGLPAPKRNTFYQLWLYDIRGESNEPVSGAILHRGSGDGEWLELITPDTDIIDPYKFELKLETDGDKKSHGQILLMVQP